MVPRVGFEPTTYGLKARCVTVTPPKDEEKTVSLVAGLPLWEQRAPEVDPVIFGDRPSVEPSWGGIQPDCPVAMGLPHLLRPALVRMARLL